MGQTDGWAPCPPITAFMPPGSVFVPPVSRVVFPPVPVDIVPAFIPVGWPAELSLELLFESEQPIKIRQTDTVNLSCFIESSSPKI